MHPVDSLGEEIFNKHYLLRGEAMDYGVETNIGTRNINQDYFYKSEKIPLYIVADGMGGHNAGEIASKESANIIGEYIEENYSENLIEIDIKNLILDSIKKANKEVYELSKSDEKLKGMGTTISLALICDGKLYIGHVGDSRIFLMRDNIIKRLTQDHSLVEELYKKGSITKEEAINHPQKNIITRAVGTEENIEVDICINKLIKDDIIIIATDGLTNMLKEDEIKENILNEEYLAKACKEMVELAKNRGGRDNITVMTIRI